MTPHEAALFAIKRMRCDSEADCFHTQDQLNALAAGLARMFSAGCTLDEDVLDHIAAGERTEVVEAYSQYDGWSEVDTLMNQIFEQDTPDA
jgi:hypothetical protein